MAAGSSFIADGQRNALHCRSWLNEKIEMPPPAERMRMMCEQRSQRASRELRLIVPDSRLQSVRRPRIGQSIGRLDDDDIRRLNIALAFVMGLAD
jgi:hypothetical protein